MPLVCGSSRRIQARGRREPIHGGSGRGIHAAHGPAPESDTRSRSEAVARLCFAWHL